MLRPSVPSKESAKCAQGTSGFRARRDLLTFPDTTELTFQSLT